MEFCLERAQIKMVTFSSRLKGIQIIGQGNTLWRSKISQSSSARKETIDIDILVMSRNGDRKIMHPIKIISGPA